MNSELKRCCLYVLCKRAFILWTFCSNYFKHQWLVFKIINCEFPKGYTPLWQRCGWLPTVYDRGYGRPLEAAYPLKLKTGWKNNVSTGFSTVCSKLCGINLKEIFTGNTAEKATEIFLRKIFSSTHSIFQHSTDFWMLKLKNVRFHEFIHFS